MANSGKVYLVGAGPGDPELITVKGVRALQQADCIVYDYLASPKLLTHADDHTEAIYVGKRAGSHYMSQEEINALLVSRAKDGQTVVRLKGGDPFIFGRGGEEGHALHSEGIPFEVIPGIPAAIGLAAYTGIPLTDRNHASQVTFVTGHEKPEKEDIEPRWERLAKLPGTLVIYMGYNTIDWTTETLIKHGMAPETPTSIVQWATTPRQKTVVATLDTVADEARTADMAPPVLIVVGDVNELRDELSWFENKPLFGKRIIVTRSKRQSSSLVEGLADLGADVMELPVIDIQPIPENAALCDAVENLGRYDWLVFTSTNGVNAFFACLNACKLDARALAGCRIAAVGHATRQALANYGLTADLIPETANGKAVYNALAEHCTLQGARILMPRSEIAHSDLPELCRNDGAAVDDIPAYRTECVEYDSQAVAEQLKAGDIDAVTFTSGSTVRNFLNQLGRDEWSDMLADLNIFSIGPVTTGVMAEFGLAPTCEAEDASVAGLITAITEYYHRK